MTENHTHDKELLKRIDALLEKEQASGVEILDDLAATQPQPRAEYTNALEARLLQRLADAPDKPKRQSDATDDIDERIRIMKRKNKNATRSRFSLTFIAAALAIFIAGGLFTTALLPRSSMPLFGSTMSDDARATQEREFQMTATELVGAATATAQAQMVEPVTIITATPMPTQGNVDSFEATATALVAGVTRTAQLESQATQRAMGRPIEITATPMPTATVSCEANPTSAWCGSQQSASGAIQATPTFMPTVTPSCDINPNTPPCQAQIPLLLAAQDIPLGEIIMSEMLTRVLISREQATQLRNEYATDTLLQNLPQAVGQQAQTFIPRFEPMVGSLVAEPLPCEPDVDCLPIPDGTERFSLTVPTENIRAYAGYNSLLPGQTVDVVYTDADTSTTTMPLNGMVLEHTMREDGISTVWLAVPTAYLAELQGMQRVDIPLQVVPAGS